MNHFEDGDLDICRHCSRINDNSNTSNITSCNNSTSTTQSNIQETNMKRTPSWYINILNWFLR
jgi:ribosome-binding protein aMBF1 (putative translation factor)